MEVTRNRGTKDILPQKIWPVILSQKMAVKIRHEKFVQNNDCF